MRQLTGEALGSAEKTVPPEEYRLAELVRRLSERCNRALAAPELTGSAAGGRRVADRDPHSNSSGSRPCTRT